MPVRGRLALFAVMIVTLAGCGGSSPAKSSTRSTAAQPSLGAQPGRYDAPGVITPAHAAPDVALRDSLGHPVRLSQFKGRAVLLTFIYTHCPDVCPLIVAHLHNALLQLGTKARQVQVVAVSVDPHGDTSRTVSAFLAEHAMTGRMEYLIGSLRQLTPVWKRYGIAVLSTPDRREVGHSAVVYGLTGSGRLFALYPANFKPAWIVHDVPLLAAQ
jgi:protein SCO1